MLRCLDDQEARTVLEAAIKACGTAQALADMLQVSAAYISQVRSGEKHIHGKLADYLGIERVTVYKLSEPKMSTEHEQYVKQFMEWREQNGMPIARMRKIV